MSAPRIYLALPDISGITALLTASLRHHGFEVISADVPMQFRYPSLGDRLRTKCRQLLLQDRDAKLRLQSKLLQDTLKRQLNRQPVDYALIIRSDLLHPDFLDFIRQNTRHTTAAYQWDGIHRYPNVWRTIPYFDRFFVFDPADLTASSQNLLPATNFYFDHLTAAPVENPNNDFYFVGFHNPDRAADIAAFACHAEQQGWQLDFRILWNQPPQAAKAVYPKNVRISDTPIDFTNNLENTKYSKVLTDFVIQAHKGLSFRAFEALGLRKKLITTNPEIRRYDFYHPNNIFIWDGLNFEGIAEFLQQPYYEIDAAVRERYSFGNWIRYILDIPPYQPIGLPETAARTQPM
ncbi:MAG: hypothetical protein Q4A62_07440 [Eikenella sp.]|nr:hypothetical protein [Eikenella sp.]